MYIIIYIVKRILKYLFLECIVVDFRLFCYFIINLLINFFFLEIYLKLIFYRMLIIFIRKKIFFYFMIV